MSLQSPSLVTGNNVTHKVDESVPTLLLFLLTIYCTTVLLTLVYKLLLCVFLLCPCRWYLRWTYSFLGGT